MQKTNSAAPDLYPQIGAERFERRDPTPYVPFELDDSLPPVCEVMSWIALGSTFLILCVALLGA